jgi:putative sugar O-methyltransferase
MSSNQSAIDPAEAAFSLYPEIRAMFDEFPRYRKEVLPSKYWEELNRKNLRQLADNKYENFKRTLARNYFTWMINPFDDQLRFLMREAGILRSLRFLLGALTAPLHPPLRRKHTFFYNTLTNLLWDYVEKNDTEGLLARLSEPLEGNPPEIMRDGRLISQDLANSVLEYQAILHPDLDRREVRTILELGPGYGRTAYVFLTLQPGCRYILVDIPPALYVAQRYLSAIFADRKIFRFRSFDRYEDLFINISSLHEMRMDQIRYYFSEIDRLARKYFYFKQWKETIIPFENEKITEADYPVRENWHLIHRQQCKVQTYFFEALYEIRDTK